MVPSTPQGIATARAETAGTQVVTIIHLHKHNPYCVLLRVFVRLQPRRCPFQSVPGRDDCALRRFNPSSIRSDVPSGRQDGHSNGRNRTSRGTSDLRPTGARYLFGRGAPSHTCLGTFSRVKPCAPLLPRASDASCSWLDVVWSCVDTRCRVADRGASAAGGDAGDRILGFGSLDNFGRYLTAFRKGLNEAGFVEGRTSRT